MEFLKIKDCLLNWGKESWQYILWTLEAMTRCTLLTLKYGLKISSCIHRAHCTLIFHNNKNRHFCIWVRDNLQKRMRLRVTQWENAFTCSQSQSKLRAHFGAVRLIRAHSASLLHTSRSTECSIILATIEGEVEGKAQPGRRRTAWIDNIRAWTNGGLAAARENARRRMPIFLWRTMAYSSSSMCIAKCFMNIYVENIKRSDN